MENLKIYSKILSINLASILILSLLTSIIHFFNLMGDQVINYLLIILPLLTIFFATFALGKRCESKGWLHGMIYALLFIVASKVIELIFLNDFYSGVNFLFYIITSLTCVLGSMVGISKVQK